MKTRGDGDGECETGVLKLGEMGMGTGIGEGTASEKRQKIEICGGRRGGTTGMVLQRKQVN